MTTTTTPNGGPDAPYALRVERGARHNDEARIHGAVFSYFGYVASRDSTVTTTDGERWRVTVPKLGEGSTCYVVEWR